MPSSPAGRWFGWQPDQTLAEGVGDGSATPSNSGDVGIAAPDLREMTLHEP